MTRALTPALLSRALTTPSPDSIAGISEPSTGPLPPIRAMANSRSAVLLIGFQNDYFAADGILHQVLESSEQTADVLDRTLSLLSSLEEQDVPAISVPILFSADYSELTNPVGLMAQIRDIGAFQRDSSGGAEVPELMALGDRVEHVYGKTSFNAFNGTKLHERLQELGVEHLIICGVVTSVCIDSTGRAASELGYRVTVVSDCIAGRSAVENEFYCESVFPLYAELSKSEDLRSDAAG